jgi:hypothetical protein
MIVVDVGSSVVDHDGNDGQDWSDRTGEDICASHMSRVAARGILGGTAACKLGFTLKLSST